MNIDKNTISNKNFLLNNLLVIGIIYVLFVIFYFFWGYKEYISPFKYAVQIIYASAFFCFLVVTVRFEININVLVALVFVSSIILSLVLRECYWKFTSTPFGLYSDNDIYDFYSVALNSMRKNFLTFGKEIAKYPRFNIDDYGLPMVLWLIYSIAGNEYIGQYLAIIVNALAVSLSTLYLYKIMMYLNIKSPYSRFFCAFFGFFPFFNTISANGGMKENFFCFLIIVSFYHMYKYKSQKNLSNLIWCLIFIFTCIFFRLVIPVMIAISLFIQLASNKKNKKRIMVNLVICFIFGVIFLDFIITFLFSQFLPLGAINLKMALNSKLNSIYYGSILFRWAVQIATVLFGAFPSFSREVTFSIMYNSGLLFKGMLSFYLVLGIIKIIKNFRYEYYSIVIYVVMGIFFCTVWGVALNMRFQITFFPFMLPIMAYSLQKFRVNRIAYYTHTILLSGLIIAYNAR